MSDGPITCHGVTYISVRALAAAYRLDDISVKLSIDTEGRTPEEAVAEGRRRDTPRPVRLEDRVYPSLEDAVAELAREQGWTKEKARYHIQRRTRESRK